MHFRRYRRTTRNNCTSSSTKGFESPENGGHVLTSLHGEDITLHNEYFQLDPTECKEDITCDSQNTKTGKPDCNAHITKSKDHYNNFYIQYKHEINIEEKGKYSYTSVSDQESSYGSNYGVYDHLGKTRKNLSLENGQNIYGHVGTAAQDECTY